MDISEVELIRRIRNLTAPFQKKAQVGVGDDTAVLAGREGYSYLFTTDTLVENVHFEWEFSRSYQSGWKALAVSSSDVAAMGGYPIFALVTLGIPASASFSTIKEVYRGILDLSCRIDVEISGGDIVGSPIFFISICVLGEVEAGRAILRSGARPGDSIYLTGEIGSAATGLLCLKQKGSLSASFIKQELIKRWLMPFPRIKEAREILKHRVATAMIDISDGLSSDLHHVLEESGVGAEVWEETLPVSSEVTKVCYQLEKSPVEVALQGGEDYELLFTASSSNRVEEEVSFPVTKIGEIVKGSQLFLVKSKGQRKKIKPGGWNHFLSSVEK